MTTKYFMVVATIMGGFQPQTVAKKTITNDRLC